MKNRKVLGMLDHAVKELITNNTVSYWGYEWQCIHHHSLDSLNMQDNNFNFFKISIGKSTFEHALTT